MVSAECQRERQYGLVTGCCRAGSYGREDIVLGFSRDTCNPELGITFHSYSHPEEVSDLSFPSHPVGGKRAGSLRGQGGGKLPHGQA